VPQRAFGPAQTVLLGRTDERAWTPLASTTAAIATACTPASPSSYDRQDRDRPYQREPLVLRPRGASEPLLPRAADLGIVVPAQKPDLWVML
jgi:hypothetical protein